VIEPKLPKQTAADERRARAGVKERDQGICVRCGRPGNNFDHRKNKSQMGRWEPSNGQTLCGSGTTGCHGWKTQNPAAAILEGFAVPGWGNPVWWPAWRDDVRSWVLYFDRADSFGRWWTEITQATADLLMSGGTP
jgi:hypothetical protein